MTDKGHQVARDVSRVWNKIRTELFEGVSDSDMACVKRVFDTGKCNMKKTKKKSNWESDDLALEEKFFRAFLFLEIYFENNALMC